MSISWLLLFRSALASNKNRSSVGEFDLAGGPCLVPKCGTDCQQAFRALRKGTALTVFIALRLSHLKLIGGGVDAFTRAAEVRIWLERGAGGAGSPAAGMAEDVAEHFKDLIKMQDKVQQLKEENTELRKLTTDEDKSGLLPSSARSDLLQASRGSVEVARLRERQQQRAVRQELEQQLQVLALALDEAEGKEPLRPLQQATESTEAADSALSSQHSKIQVDSLAAERDELLAVRGSEPGTQAAGFLAPLGFAPSKPNREVTAWEAAAERLGHQAMTLSMAGPAKGCEHPEPPPPPIGLVAPPRQATVALPSPEASGFSVKSGPVPDSFTSSLAKGPVPPAPPAGFSGVFKSAPLEAAAKPAAAPTATAAAQGTERAQGGMKHVYFDFDQTISKIHVFKQLAGWEPGVDAPHALSERGQIHRLKMLNADLQYTYQSSNGMVVPCAAGAKGSSWTAC
ncbi:hypothetical protein AK812_SmicGene44164, partial [Symbiodinium microadriaticum]